MKTSEAERAEKFRAAATRRVRNVETTLRRVKNLSNPSSYHYTQQDVERMFDHLQELLDHTRDSFRGQRDREQFSL